MIITVLGCGFSSGVPVIGCRCPVCLSSSEYNKRSRCAILIENNNTKILVDFGPDIRNQLLRNNIEYLDAVICTHAHADHIAGFDDLKVLTYHNKSKLNLISTKETISSLKNTHGYMFNSDISSLSSPFEVTEIDYYDKISIKDIHINFFQQTHGKISSLGLKIDNFVYSNDVNEFPEQSWEYLNNIKFWILDCIDYQATKAHAGLEDVLTWKNNFNPQHIYLTNLNHNLDYNNLQKKLPEGIKLCHDNMVIKVI